MAVTFSGSRRAPSSLLIPKGRRLKQNRPVMKVANLAQSGCRGICQHPLDAPSFEKYREPASLGEISSRVDNTNLTCTLQGTIQLSQIDANPWLSNVLRYWYHRCTPFTWLCYSFDDTRFSSSSTFGTGIRGKAILLVGLIP